MHEMSLMNCGDCDAGAACGVCLMLVAALDCPDSTHDMNVAMDCFSSTLQPGTQTAVAPTFCEGDGECGTSDVADNCPNFDDMYRLVSCTGDFIPDRFIPSPPPPGLPPFPPPVRPGADGAQPIGGGDSGHSGTVIMATLWALVVLVAAVLLCVFVRRQRPKLVDRWIEFLPGRQSTGLRSRNESASVPFAFNPQFALSRAEQEAVVTELTALPQVASPLQSPPHVAHSLPMASSVGADAGTGPLQSPLPSTTETV